MTQPTRGVPIFGEKKMLTLGFKARFLIFFNEIEKFIQFTTKKNLFW
jgi:hypothetical protein